MESELGGDAPWLAAAARANSGLRDGDRWREVRTVERSGVRTITADGREVVHFASNDYLGLSVHPAVVEAALAAIEEWGAGAGSSRVVVGSRPVHDELEAALADWKHAEDALLFPTGYQANVGVLGALARLGEAVGSPVAIVSDELNHASIIDGCRLARVPVAVFPHADPDGAGAAIERFAAEGRRSVLVTDSVFSMDGDYAPLEALASVTRRTGALLVVDDAHAVFPLRTPLALLDAEVLVVGTLSKTLGSIGGFVAGPTDLVAWIRNTARSSIFSTAAPPSTAAAALAALDVVRSAEGAELVATLRRHVDRFVPGHPSAVVPIVLGEERRALDVSAALLERGLLVPAIRPPTVAPGTSRLRVALSAAHTDDEVTSLLDALADLGIAPAAPAAPEAVA